MDSAESKNLYAGNNIGNNFFIIICKMPRHNNTKNGIQFVAYAEPMMPHARYETLINNKKFACFLYLRGCRFILLEIKSILPGSVKIHDS